MVKIVNIGICICVDFQFKRNQFSRTITLINPNLKNNISDLGYTPFDPNLFELIPSEFSLLIPKPYQNPLCSFPKNQPKLFSVLIN